MRVKPASELSSEQLAALFNDGFSTYVVEGVVLDAPAMEYWIAAHFVSLERSYIFYPAEGEEGDPEQPIAMGLLCMHEDRPGEARLGIMAVASKAQGKGVGTKALEHIIAAERSHGLQVLELECIQRNARAVKLYQGAGFSITRELLGWERDAAPAGDFAADPGLVECTPAEVAPLVRKHGAPNLPWQPWHFETLRGADRAFRLGNAWCVVQDPEKAEDKKDEDKKKEPLGLYSLLVDPAHRGQGEARKLIQAMLGRFPGRKWIVRPVFPKELGQKLAEEFGFEDSVNKQYQMRLNIAA